MGSRKVSYFCPLRLVEMGEGPLQNNPCLLTQEYDDVLSYSCGSRENWMISSLMQRLVLFLASKMISYHSTDLINTDIRKRIMGNCEWKNMKSGTCQTHKQTYRYSLFVWIERNTSQVIWLSSAAYAQLRNYSP